MSTSDWVLVANLGAVVVAAIAILAGLRGVQVQMRNTTFLEYTERYNTIMSALPFYARQPGSGFDVMALSADKQTELFETYRAYFNLCWEEQWLRKLKRIDSKTWKVWTLSMRQVMDYPGFDEAWRVLRPEYQPYGTFVAFFEGIRAMPS
jgi:hypothetical protein